MVALVLQWAAPAVHGLELVHAHHACDGSGAEVHHEPSPVDPVVPTNDHDEGTCSVCLILAHARDGAPPTLVLCVIDARPIARADRSTPLAPRGEPRRTDASPRAPPALA
ncbi:MAG: DUF2946 family protein [Phycisphaerales bacterium]|nr:DUF2946 family protein [Phycisphaerales bacterium]